jgi:hypothetical protein
MPHALAAIDVTEFLPTSLSNSPPLSSPPKFEDRKVLPLRIPPTFIAVPTR